MPIGGGGYVSGVYPAKGQNGLVYARTDVGGAYRYDQGAGKWVALNDALNEDNAGLLSVDSLAVDPKSSGHILMLMGNKNFGGGRTMIMRSTDYGKSFAYIDVTKQFKTDGNEDGRHSERLAFDPGSSNVIYAGTRFNGLFRSTDWGYTWTRLNLDVTTTFNNSGISTPPSTTRATPSSPTATAPVRMAGLRPRS